MNRNMRLTLELYSKLLNTLNMLARGNKWDLSGESTLQCSGVVGANELI